MLPYPTTSPIADDPDGLKCPLHAHIRKINPRGELDKKSTILPNSPERERMRRVAHRGIPYGTRETEPKDDPSIEELPTARQK